MAHASCCALFLLAYETRGMAGDDRPATLRDADWAKGNGER